jgi:hypothetical protein
MKSVATDKQCAVNRVTLFDATKAVVYSRHARIATVRGFWRARGSERQSGGAGAATG